ncbi:MAG: sigma-70 family RNA polymerase sigma factor, partial [Bacillota bacterium]
MLDIDDIYEDYARIVFKFLISLCNDADTAEELTQETFYRAIKSAKRYDGTCKVSTWLCQIAKHVWFQEIDKRKRKETSALDDNIVSDQLNLEEKLCLTAEKMLLIKAVHILDETAKEVVLLR